MTELPLQAESAVTGWLCLVCGRNVPISQPMVFRCPNATVDDPWHALQIVHSAQQIAQLVSSSNPFIAYRPHFAWDAFGAALGLPCAERVDLVETTNQQVIEVCGTGFHSTPFARADSLSAALGFNEAGGVWIKDETHQVGGSHKARHLLSAMLALLIAESRGYFAGRPKLAIASCGNAAIAAAVLAAGVGWPIEVFVPPSAHPRVLEELRKLGAQVTVCARRSNDAPGDPCILRYRESVAAGSVPFSVQGPENAWCLDGGRSIGWEMASVTLDRVFVQVGGGAFARCLFDGLAQGAPLQLPRFHAVQTEGCAPLQRAWKRALDGPGGMATAASRWSECMTPWEREPMSAADGILDDETYDWLGVSNSMIASGGVPVVAAETDVLQAHQLCQTLTSIDASPTGTAGLAGLLAIRNQIGAHERVAVVFSGIRREPR